MRVPVSWLSEYVQPGLPAGELADRLTMTGTKVEAIHHHGVGDVGGFVIGHVLEAQQHPDADRLTVCRVDVGEAEPEQIVCGAPNVAAGQTVAVARPGAVMPDGSTLGTAELRGVESHGMILAEDELGIGPDHAGIMVLGDGLPPGTPLDQALPIATEVLELEITPNRPDCLGLYGVAREAHAATGAELAPPPWAEDAHPAGEAIEGVEIAVECPDLCPRFTVRAFEDVTIGPSPPWLKARLTAAGQRPINNVVDITNYVMLLTGQPLHAFDLDRVAGGRLLVRRAADGETIETLDGQARELDSDMVVIEDGDGPTSIAGVMGGARSEVQDGTTRVLMEAATWDGPNINRTSGRLTLRSEASGRFEKGLSPRQTIEAQIVAGALLVELCGARPVGGTIDVGGPGPDPSPVRLREARVGELVGVPVALARQVEILRSLGFGVTEDGDGLLAEVPHWRARDVYREADLVEEVARIDGVDRLPATLHAPHAAGELTPAQRAVRRAQDVLVGRGLYEIAGWSFTDPGFLDRLRVPADHPMRRVVTVENPMSERESILRPGLLGSRLDAAAHNLARGATDLGIFEYGAIYRASDGALPDETRALGALLVGRGDVLAAKALLEAVLSTLRVEWSMEQAEEPFLHPGKTGVVVVGGEEVGLVGEVHPLVTREWDIDRQVAAFAVDLDAVVAAAPEVTLYRDVTSFPSVREDIAVVVADDVSAGRVLEVVRAAGGELLERARVFDVFRGEQLGEGRVSLAIHLEFRAPDRTLTDEDVAPVRDAIVAALRSEVGGELRG
jgi:phenylalanyl-tRNA synthetase beta chain